MAERLTTPQQLQRRTFSLLFFLLMSVGMGQSLAFIVVPPVAREVGLNEVEVGLVYAFSALLWLWASPIWGRLSDRLGRRRIIVIGGLGYALSLVLFITVLRLGQWGWIPMGIFLPLLILARLINGGLGSATRPASLGFVADFTTTARRTRGFSRVEAGFALGIAAGPMLGSLLFMLGSQLGEWGLASHYQDVLPFFVFAALGGGLAIFAGSVLPQASAHRLGGGANRSDGSEEPLRPWDVSIWPFMILAVIHGIGNAVFAQTAAFYFLDALSAPRDDLNMLVSLGFGLMSGGNVLLTLLIVPRLNLQPRFLLRAGSVFLMLAAVLMLFKLNLTLAMMSMCLFGIGSGMLIPGRSAALSLTIDAHRQGEAMGLIGSVMPIGHVLSPVLIMPLYLWDSAAPYGLLVVLCFLGVLLTLQSPVIRALGAR
ncbi:MAG: MFS transporter [Gammaproteobacteria bacterium AqS3]|nr:MFS transporter [Gammaproteobacteria bacterium AqS3]